MAPVKSENGAPERIGKLVGTVLAGLVALAVVVMMIYQFA